jgi:rare lipoprotein A (peptidoglycan hydrolase)
VRLRRRGRTERRDELARAAARVLRDRESRRIARRDPRRLAYMIADEILVAEKGGGFKPARPLAIAAPTLALAATPTATIQPHPGCAKTFTLRMDHRAAHAIYSGLRHITEQDLRVLGYIERCQRRVRDWPVARRFNRTLGREHKQMVLQARLAASLTYATASWYQDAGQTASGFHAGYGVANKTLPFGTRVLFAYHGRTVTATVDDRGPYIAGREWDLNQTTAAALGFSGVDTVGYRVLG